MTKYVFQQSIFAADDHVSIAPYAQITVTDAATGLAAELWEDADGLVPIVGNVIVADETGFVRFYVSMGLYDIAILSGGETQTLANVDIGGAAAAQESAAAADASATAAQAAQAAAETAQTGAETAQTAAEAARDASIVNSQTYVDEATGRAAVADGATFDVQGSGYVASYRYRRVNSTTSTLIATFPSKAFVDLIWSLFYEQSSDEYAAAIVDSLGGIALGLTAAGVLKTVSLTVQGSSGAIAITGTSDGIDINGATLSAYTNDEWLFALPDPLGGIALGVKRTGEVFVGALSAASVSTPAATDDTIPAPYYQSEIVHVLSYGQSLSVGSQGSPIITTSQRFNSLMFNSGTRPWVAGTYTSLVPLVESIDGDLGETVLSGATECINELVASEDGLAYSAHSYQLMASAPGQGGASIEDLSKGGSYYSRVTTDVTNALPLATAASKSYSVGAVFWTQGEANINAGTDRAAYELLLDTLHSDLDTDLRAITDQSTAIPMIGYQVASHRWYSKDTPTIALAQLDRHKRGENYFIACPAYQFAYAADGLHLSAASYKKMGAYYGLAYKRVVVDRESWDPLRPISFFRQGNILIARFNKSGLVVDTTAVSDPGNYGFSAVDASGNAMTISSVTVLGDDRVKFVFVSATAANMRLRAGFNGTAGGPSGPTAGARVCLRDSQGDAIIFDPLGLNYPLHNWCVFFDEVIA